jgi:transposase
MIVVGLDVQNMRAQSPAKRSLNGRARSLRSDCGGGGLSARDVRPGAVDACCWRTVGAGAAATDGTATSTAPLDASSGKHQRRRLERGGNRQLNCALHRIAITQGRVYPPADAYLERKESEGNSRREAIRCLKRQLARTVYTTLKTESALT